MYTGSDRALNSVQPPVHIEAMLRAYRMRLRSVPFRDLEIAAPLKSVYRISSCRSGELEGRRQTALEWRTRPPWRRDVSD